MHLFSLPLQGGPPAETPMNASSRQDFSTVAHGSQYKECELLLGKLSMAEELEDIHTQIHAMGRRKKCLPEMERDHGEEAP